MEWHVQAKRLKAARGFLSRLGQDRTGNTLAMIAAALTPLLAVNRDGEKPSSSTGSMVSPGWVPPRVDKICFSSAAGTLRASVHILANRPLLYRHRHNRRPAPRAVLAGVETLGAQGMGNADKQRLPAVDVLILKP